MDSWSQQILETPQGKNQSKQHELQTKGCVNKYVNTVDSAACRSQHDIQLSVFVPEVYLD